MKLSILLKLLLVFSLAISIWGISWGNLWHAFAFVVLVVFFFSINKTENKFAQALFVVCSMTYSIFFSNILVRSVLISYRSIELAMPVPYEGYIRIDRIGNDNCGEKDIVIDVPLTGIVQTCFEKRGLATVYKFRRGDQLFPYKTITENTGQPLEGLYLLASEGSDSQNSVWFWRGSLLDAKAAKNQLTQDLKSPSKDIARSSDYRKFGSQQLRHYRAKSMSAVTK